MQTLFVASLCGAKILLTFEERIEIHEIFIWPSFELKKRGFYISAFASFVCCAIFRSERTKKGLEFSGSSAACEALGPPPATSRLPSSTKRELPQLLLIPPEGGLALACASPQTTLLGLSVRVHTHI